MENNMPTVEEMQDSLRICNPNAKLTLNVDCRQRFINEKPSEGMVLTINSEYLVTLDYIVRW